MRKLLLAAMAGWCEGGGTPAELGWNQVQGGGLRRKSRARCCCSEGGRREKKKGKGEGQNWLGKRRSKGNGEGGQEAARFAGRGVLTTFANSPNPRRRVRTFG